MGGLVGAVIETEGSILPWKKSVYKSIVFSVVVLIVVVEPVVATIDVVSL